MLAFEPPDWRALLVSDGGENVYQLDVNLKGRLIVLRGSWN